MNSLTEDQKDKNKFSGRYVEEGMANERWKNKQTLSNKWLECSCVRANLRRVYVSIKQAQENQPAFEISIDLARNRSSSQTLENSRLCIIAKFNQAYASFMQIAPKLLDQLIRKASLLFPHVTFHGRPRRIQWLGDLFKKWLTRHTNKK